jgi:ATP-dependent protease ClpP protease subunit
MPTVYLYSEIVEGDAERVVQELREGGPVTVRINSVGGVASESLAIYNALKPRNPTIYIDGIAASSASLIAMAGKRIVMAENALLMLHNPWTLAQGDASSLRQTADTLDKFRNAMLTAYGRSGLSESDIVSMLDAETWLNATEALRLGFADEVADALPYAARFDFSKFKNVPRELIMPQANSNTQTPNQQPAANVNAQPQNAASGEQEIIARLQTRNTNIRARLQPLMEREGIRDLYEQALADPLMDIEYVTARALKILGNGVEPLYGVPLDATAPRYTEDFRAAATDAIVMRAGILLTKPHPGAADLRNTSIADIARLSLSRDGKHASDFSRGSLIKAAMSTSDFPYILENALGKSLRAGFEAEPPTHKAWCKQSTVPDFKEQSRVILGSAPDLKKVLEGAEYTYGSIDEDKATFTVTKYGRIIWLTYEALVNDDLGAFSGIGKGLGLAAQRIELDTVYTTLLQANSGGGQTMQDSKDLFHADHNNLADSVSSIDSAALGSGRTLLRKQKTLGGAYMNLQPKFLLVAPEKEQAMEVLLASSARSMNQGSSQTLTAPWIANLELIVEPRLDDTAFYLIANSGQIDTLELAYLDSDGGPVVEQEDGFDVDSRKYKARHVFGARFLDWRGIVKVPYSS